MAAGLDAQQGDRVVGDPVPVREQPAGPELVQEEEAGAVGRPLEVEHRRVEHPAEGVGGDHVQPGVLHDGRQGRSCASSSTWTPSLTVSVTGRRRRVRPSGVSSASSRSRWARSSSPSRRAWATPPPRRERPGRLTALEPYVVLHAHPGQHRDLLPAQPGDPAPGRDDGQPGLFWGDPGAPGDEERPEGCAGGVLVDHAPEARTATGPERVTASTPSRQGLPVPAAPGRVGGPRNRPTQQELTCATHTWAPWRSPGSAWAR